MIHPFLTMNFSKGKAKYLNDYFVYVVTNENETNIHAIHKKEAKEYLENYHNNLLTSIWSKPNSLNTLYTLVSAVLCHQLRLYHKQIKLLAAGYVLSKSSAYYSRRSFVSVLLTYVLCVVLDGGISNEYLRQQTQFVIRC